MTDYRPILYHRAISIECLRVRRVINELGVDVEYRDILTSPKNRGELEQIAGKIHVPCLVLGGSVVAHTDQIIKYLRLRYGSEDQPRS